MSGAGSGRSASSNTARLDPEDMRQVIHAYQGACSGILARYDGFVAKFFGDGILATFGFPRAHEDDAARAVHAALDITEAVGRLQTRAREKLAVRVGIQGSELGLNGIYELRKS
jgi:class 3 adenylate cyclase